MKTSANQIAHSYIPTGRAKCQLYSRTRHCLLYCALTIEPKGATNFDKTSNQPLFKISDLKMDQIEDLNLELPDIAEWAEFDGILDLGSDGASSLSSPNHYSTSSSCSSPFSTGSSVSPLDSPDPTFTDQQLFGGGSSLKCETGSGVSTKKRTPRTRRTRKSSSHRSGETKHKRNERERRRVKKLSDAFISLRDSVPYCVGDKKLSKLETLKYALYYMYTLSRMLYEDDMRKRASNTEQWLALQQDQLRKSQVNMTQQNVIVNPTYSAPILLVPAHNNGAQSGWLSFVNAVAVPVAAAST